MTDRAKRVLRAARAYLVGAAAGWPIEPLRLEWARFICKANKQ